jgi:hypothetical protein
LHIQHTNVTAFQFQNINKAITIAILCLLMLGYLAVNLWEWKAFTITLIRAATSVIIVALLALSWPAKMGVPVLAIGIVALIGIPTSGISLGILFLCLTVLALRKLSVEFIANSSAFVLGIALTMSVLMVHFGIVANEEDVAGSALELGGEIRSRMTFGYRNVNSFAGIASGFCLLIMMTGRHSIARYAIAVLVSYLLYMDTDSRAMLLATFSFISFTLIFLLARNRPWFLKAFATLMLITPLMLSVFANLVVSEAPLLDLVLSGRLSLVTMFFSELPSYRFLIGGAEPSSGTTVDNSFALMAGAIGIPLLIYVTYITYQRVLRCVDEADFRIYSFLLAFWLYSFAESSMLRPESIICIVFWVLVLRPEPKLALGKYPL